MPITKNDIAIKVAQKLGLYGGLNELTSEDTSLIIDNIESMIAMWEGAGLHLGYNFADPDYGPDPSDDSGISNSHLNAVVLNAAVQSELDLNVSPNILMKQQAFDAYRLLFDTVPMQKQQNPFMPSGQGYNRGCYTRRNYMPTNEPITIEDDGNLDPLTAE
jgi:hypothetical protein